MTGQRFPEVNNNLLCLVNIEDQVVDLTPVHQVFRLMPVGQTELLVSLILVLKLDTLSVDISDSLFNECPEEFVFTSLVGFESFIN